MTMVNFGSTWVALVLHFSLCPLLCGFSIPLVEEAEPMDISGGTKIKRLKTACKSGFAVLGLPAPWDEHVCDSSSPRMRRVKAELLHLQLTPG